MEKTLPFAAACGIFTVEAVAKLQFCNSNR
jgi:hypothetical protein